MLKLNKLIFRALVGASILCFTAGAYAADAPALRPEFGKPLQEAQQDIQSKNYKAALTKVSEAEKVGNLSPYEKYVLEQMRAAAALGAGDTNTVLKAYDAAIATGQADKNTELAMIETMIKLSYRAKDYGKAASLIDRYKSAGGSSSQITDLLPQAQYLSGDYAGAYKTAAGMIASSERAGHKPDKTLVQIMTSSADKTNNQTAYVAGLEKLVQYYPEENYWKDLIQRAGSAPGFSDRLALDVYRLRLQVGTLDSSDDFMTASQLAIQANLPGEAEKYAKAGRDKGILGTGAGADRQKRLEGMIQSKMKEDHGTLAESEKIARQKGNAEALLNTGLDYVGYGEYDKGLALMKEAIAKGNLAKMDDAKLHLGYALSQAGKKSEAIATFKTVGGADGTKRLAELWILSLS